MLLIIPAHTLHSGRTVGEYFEKINRPNTPIAQRWLIWPTVHWWSFHIYDTIKRHYAKWALVGAFSVIVKFSRRFVWSSTGHWAGDHLTEARISRPLLTWAGGKLQHGEMLHYCYFTRAAIRLSCEGLTGLNVNTELRWGLSEELCKRDVNENCVKCWAQ